MERNPTPRPAFWCHSSADQPPTLCEGREAGWEILHTTGLLTRVVGAETPIDAIVSAFGDLRVGPSFAVADLVCLHPHDWNYLKLQKCTTGLYVLAQNEPNSLGAFDNIFRVHTLVNTKVPQGTAIVLDTNISFQAWTRLGMEVMANQYGDYESTQNAWTFRAEERVTVGVIRPTAICVVSGINPGGGLIASVRSSTPLSSGFRQTVVS